MINLEPIPQSDKKYRHELKYIVSYGQLVQIQRRLNGLIPLDPHAGCTGRYNIRSLYFDDYSNRCYYENLSGVDPREKFRIRIYNHESARISLECKRKERGKTLKSSCRITESQYGDIIDGSIDIGRCGTPLMKKVFVEIKNRGLHPVIIVEYDRIPYIYKNGNVRITLDMNVSSSTSIKDFFKPQISKRPVMPIGYHLLEVKYDEYLPDFIYRALQLDNLQQTAYSKYFLCRKYSI